MRLDSHIRHFNQDLLDVREGSNIHKLLSAFLDEADKYQKIILLNTLTASIDKVQYGRLDALFGNPLLLPRLNTEIYELYDNDGARLSPENDDDLLTHDQWDEIMIKDAEYRERIKSFMKAVHLGGTKDGIKWAYRAATGSECTILENFKYRSLILGKAMLTDDLPPYESFYSLYYNTYDPDYYLYFVYDSGDATDIAITNGRIYGVNSSIALNATRSFGLFSETTKYHHPIASMKYYVHDRSEIFGFKLKYIDNQNYLRARIDDNGVDTFLYIDAIVAGATTQSSTLNITRWTATNSYYLQASVDENIVTINHYTSDPETGAAPVSTSSLTLNAANTTIFGSGTNGHTYADYTPGTTSSYIDWFIIESKNTNIYVNDSLDAFPNTSGSLISIGDESVSYQSWVDPTSTATPYQIGKRLLGENDRPYFRRVTRGGYEGVHKAGIIIYEENEGGDDALGKYDPTGATEFTIVPNEDISNDQRYLVQLLVDRIKPAYSAFTIDPNGVTLAEDIPIVDVEASSVHYELQETMSSFSRRSEHLSDNKLTIDNVSTITASSEYTKTSESYWEWLGNYSLTDTTFRVLKDYRWNSDSISFRYGRETTFGTPNALGSYNPSDGLIPNQTKARLVNYHQVGSVSSDGRVVHSSLKSIDPSLLSDRTNNSAWKSYGYDNPSSGDAFEWMEMVKNGAGWTSVVNSHGDTASHGWDFITHVEVRLPSFDTTGKVTCYVSVKQDTGGWMGSNFIPTSRSKNSHWGANHNGDAIPYVYKVNLDAGTTLIDLHQITGPSGDVLDRSMWDTDRVRLTFTNFKHHVNNVGGKWGVKILSITPVMAIDSVFPITNLRRRYKQSNGQTTTPWRTEPLPSISQRDPSWTRWFCYHSEGLDYDNGMNDQPVLMDLGTNRSINAAAIKLWMNDKYPATDNRSGDLGTEVRVWGKSNSGKSWVVLSDWTTISSDTPKWRGDKTHRLINFSQSYDIRYLRFYFRNHQYHNEVRLTGTFIGSLRAVQEYENVVEYTKFPASNIIDGIIDNKHAWVSMLTTPGEIEYYRNNNSANVSSSTNANLQRSHNDNQEWIDLVLNGTEQINLLELELDRAGYNYDVFFSQDGELVHITSGTNNSRQLVIKTDQVYSTDRIRIHFSNLKYIQVDPDIKEPSDARGVLLYEIRAYLFAQNSTEWALLAAESTVRDWGAEKAIDGSATTFWESAGKNSPEAVEWLILHIYDSDDYPQRVDKIRINPVWAGCQFNLYASMDKVNWERVSGWWNLPLSRAEYRFDAIVTKYLKVEFYDLTARLVGNNRMRFAQDYDVFPDDLIDEARSKTMSIMDNLISQISDFSWSEVGLGTNGISDSIQLMQYNKNFPQMAYNWVNNNLLNITNDDQMNRFWTQFEELRTTINRALQTRKLISLSSGANTDAIRGYLQSLPQLEAVFPSFVTHDYSTSSQEPMADTMHFVAVKELKAYKTTFISNSDEYIYEDDFIDEEYLEYVETDEGVEVVDGSLVVNVPSLIYRDSVRDLNPILFYRMGERSGLVANDQSNNNYDGEYGEGVVLGSSGAINNDSNRSVTLGANDGAGTLTGYINTPHNALLDTMADMSIEFWINPDGVEDLQIILQKSNTGTGYDYNYKVYLEEGNVYFQYQTVSTLYEIMISTPIEANKWTHIVISYDGSVYTTYINGALDDTYTLYDDLDYTGSGILQIGYEGLVDSYSGAYLGRIDELAIYPAALSAADALNHYNLGVGNI